MPVAQTVGILEVVMVQLGQVQTVRGIIERVGNRLKAALRIHPQGQ